MTFYFQKSQKKYLLRRRFLPVYSRDGGFFFLPAAQGAVVQTGGRGSSQMRRTLISRQFFFAVGKPHRPMDAKLTGEDAGRFPFIAVVF
jgi:hypothetical protein